MSGIGESRTELINWLNGLLHLNYKKIEECGSGAAYCQIMDSIYGDIPMHRVKFDGTAEYEFQTNFKVLQGSFAKHHIEKTVYVEKLIRCRFQDNLEFLQWLKKYWVQNKDESFYDPEARRKHRPINSGHPTPGGTSINISKRSTSGSSIGFGSNGTASNSLGSRSSSYGLSRRVPSDQLVKLQDDLSQATLRITSLNKEIGTYKEAMNIMERERDFYFGKLRDIEILVQSTQDLIKEGIYNAGGGDLSKVLNKVQQILYATEDGFEVNQEDGQMLDQETAVQDDNQRSVRAFRRETAQDVPAHNLITDEETF
ncbi:hypothetical protein HG535_0F02990 [Zygotorulaspora mrakii]|uniref:EB1 C-terminal domain-containing protein n=1 Tax=Zygotorulaspora mrakii TaxID=42260 RepID=A0A7H9B523_ZYGMR|nr:uncharacterized protein HG535_0F02990 [Zygotorulaspora mrakii]QLG73788.1 hypothetical protein HG535_0F02990 [Zygotorulaspora mrakii]